jgi:endonuclease/exonuclease/phosphatase family metal-dependent hydrolase
VLRTGVLRTAFLLAFVVACRGESVEREPMPPDATGTYPPPRSDAFMRLGSADTLEIAAWNIENFPALTGTTAARVADLITSMDLDLVLVEEIASETAWAELIARLPEHEGILSEHRYSPTEYQKLGIIYRSSMITPSQVMLLFTSDAYNFPRPPLSALLAIDDGVHQPMSIRTIGLHLKAGVGTEDGERRRAALGALDTYVRAKIAAGDEDEIVIAGDYNEVLNTSVGQANFAALLSAPDLYTVQTQAASDRGEISFVPSSVLLDHITTTAALTDDLVGSRLVIPRLQTLPQYQAQVSDHLPVVLIVPLR